MAHEFEVIQQFFKPLSQSLALASSLDIGIGDDGAVLSCLPGHQLVVVTDTLIENIHFPGETDPYDIAWKALAVNLSDLAAMGAIPAFFSLALTLPDRLTTAKNNQAWLKSFSQGLAELSLPYEVILIGGDTTHAQHLSITITAHGWVEQGLALTRSQAKVGDEIYVSGVMGEGGLALKTIQGQWLSASEAALAKLNRPQPRVSLGRALQSLATSAIDISDGLLADLNHILEASQVGATIHVNHIPISDEMKQYQQSSDDWVFPFTCGDDYELCFTVPAGKAHYVAQIADELALPLTRIGQISAVPGQLLLEKDGEAVRFEKPLGFEHF